MKFIEYAIKTPPHQIWRRIVKRMAVRRRINLFDKDHPCVFVLSTGRVGTETLSALLNLSPNLLSLHEPHPLLFKMSKRAYQEDMLDGEGIWDDALLSLRTDLFESALSCGVGYAETSPQATFLAPAIYRAIPSAKFIHLVRHPANVVRSGMRRSWYAGHPSDENRITPRKDSETYKKWLDMVPLAKISWLWAETNHWIFEFTKTLPDEKYLFLKSEDIFNGNKETLKRLFSFCSSELPEENKIQKKLSKIYNKSKVGNFPTFEKWSTDDVDLLKCHAGKMAEKMKGLS